MVEKRPVIENERISYTGIFSLKDIYKLLQGWMIDQGYIPVERRVHETVTKTGKNVEVDFEPYKKLTDYAKSVIRINVLASDMKQVEVTRDGKKRNLNQGTISIVIDSWLETDYEGRWETQPFYYVLRTIFERYVYTPYMSGFIKSVRDDTVQVRDQLKAYLNLERFK